MLTVNSAYSSLKFLHILLYFFGCKVIRKLPNGTYKRSIAGHVQCFVNLFIYFVYFYKYINKDAHVLHYGSKFVSVSHYIQIILHVIIMLTILCINVMNSRKLCKFFEDIDRIDANINAIYKTNMLERNNRLICKTSLILIITGKHTIKKLKAT